MNESERVQATREMLAQGGIEDFDDAAVARVAAGAGAATGAVQRLRDLTGFDAVPGNFLDALKRGAGKDEPR